MDSVSKERRSEIMSRVRGRDTAPELRLRRLVHGMGYRYRLHVAGLPGRPDMVLARHRAVIFMHGCFWHRHEGCALARMPKSRLEFWQPKLDANRERDARNVRELRRLGWRVLVVWECELGDEVRLRRRVGAFLARGG